MPRNIVIRPAARADLESIWDHTHETWGRAQAQAYLSTMHETINRLADFPALARLREDITPPVRIHPHRAHVIIYMETETTLDVIRVLPARSNWTRYLGS